KRKRTTEDCIESPAKSGQSNVSKFNDTSSAAPAATVPTIRDHADIWSPKASHEGECRSRDRHIGCTTKLPRNMKTTKMLVSRSTPGRFTTSGMHATSTTT